MEVEVEMMVAEGDAVKVELACTGNQVCTRLATIAQVDAINYTPDRTAQSASLQTRDWGFQNLQGSWCL